VSKTPMGTRAFRNMALGGLVVGLGAGFFSAGVTVLVLLVALVVFVKVQKAAAPVGEEVLATLGTMERLYWRTRYLGIFCGLVIGLLISNADSLKKPKSAVLPTDAAEVESGGAELAVEPQPAPAVPDGRVRIDPQTGAVIRGGTGERRPPSYRIIDEEVSESHIKTQVSLKVIIPPETNRAGLDAIMREVYAATSTRTGFKLRKHPNALYLYFFTSEHTARTSPTSSVGAVLKAAADAGPSYSNQIGAGGLSAQVVKALGIAKQRGPGVTEVRGGEEPDSAVVVSTLTVFANGKKSLAKKVDRNRLWSVLFIRAELLFERVGALSAVTLQEKLGDDVVVDVTITRSQWESMGYRAKRVAFDASVVRVEEEAMARRKSVEWEDKRVGKLESGLWRDLLGALPKSAKRIKKVARP
jgi:hypothetical protein